MGGAQDQAGEGSGPQGPPRPGHGHDHGGQKRRARRRLTAPLARRQRPGLCALGRPPGPHAGPSATGHDDPHGRLTRSGVAVLPPSSLPIVPLAAPASRSPSGRRCAIGCAEPGSAAHSPGISRLRG
jgi:hypothetical protein